MNRNDPKGTCDNTTYSTGNDGTIIVDCTDSDSGWSWGDPFEGFWESMTGSDFNPSAFASAMCLGMSQCGDPYLTVTPAMALQFTFDQGYGDAMSALAIPSCAGLFTNGAAVMQALGDANPQQLLAQYYSQGWLTFGTTFIPNGGGAPQAFADLGPNALTNTGGVTTYANAAYTNGNGVNVSVNQIALNTNSFVFTGMVQSNGFLAAVGTVVPGQFGGMSQAQITAAAIIHELLHAVGAIPQDGTSPGQSATNSANVKNNCF